MPERMDRKQLREASRVIARLVRSKAVAKRTKQQKPEPDEAEPVLVRTEGYQQTMHLKLDATDIANLDKIVAVMKRHPIVGRLQAGLGREKAARYAIAHFVEQLPASTTQTG